MSRLTRFVPSPAMVVALLALVLAAAGPGNAAFKAMFAKNADTVDKIHASKTPKPNRLLALSRTGKLPASVLPRTQGPQGVQGVAGANGERGEKGDRGETGPPGPFPSGPLPRGTTLRGVYDVETYLSAAGYFGNAYSYGFSLLSPPDVHFIAKNTTPPSPECPGSVTDPEAAPGQLCVYEHGANNVALVSIQNPETQLPDTTGSVYGFAIDVLAGGPGFSYTMGTWAVTAP